MSKISISFIGRLKGAKCPKCGSKAERVEGHQYLHICTNEKCLAQFEHGIGKE